MLLLIPMAAMMSITIDLVDYEKAEQSNPQIMQAGAPALPYLAVKILLPMGEGIESVAVNYSGEQKQLERELEPVQEPQPFSRMEMIATKPDAEIYGNNAFYPEVPYRNLGTQRQNGFDILYLLVIRDPNRGSLRRHI